MGWDEVQGIGLGVIRTNQHNQGSSKRSWWSNSKGDEEGLSKWDLALGMDHDGLKIILPEVATFTWTPCYCCFLPFDEISTSLCSSSHKKPDGLIFILSLHSSVNFSEGTKFASVGVGVKGEDWMECSGGFDILWAGWSIQGAHGLQLSCT